MFEKQTALFSRPKRPPWLPAKPTPADNSLPLSLSRFLSLSPSSLVYGHKSSRIVSSLAHCLLRCLRRRLSGRTRALVSNARVPYLWLEEVSRAARRAPAAPSALVRFAVAAQSARMCSAPLASWPVRAGRSQRGDGSYRLTNGGELHQRRAACTHFAHNWRASVYDSTSSAPPAVWHAGAVRP